MQLILKHLNLFEVLEFITTQRILFPTLLVCGGKLTASSQMRDLYSHMEYPAGKPYPANHTCSWLIASNGRYKKIQIKFRNFELEDGHCFFDYVTLYDGDSPSAQKIVTLCGKNLKYRDFTSSKNSLYIEFRTDKKIERRGFYAQYRRIRTSITSDNARGFQTETATEPPRRTRDGWK